MLAAETRDIEINQNADGSYRWRVFDKTTDDTISSGDGFSSVYAANIEAEKHLNE